MAEQKHLIGKEKLEITVSDRTAGISLQNAISEIVKYSLNPALDRLFSSISTNDETVRIDSLTIDLGTISSSDLDQRLVPLAVQEIEDQIRKLASAGKHRDISSHRNGKKTNGKRQQFTGSKHPPSIKPGDISKRTNGNAGSTPYSTSWQHLLQGGESGGKAGAQVIPESREVLEQFIYFLHNGRFPWWRGKASPDEAHKILLKVLEGEQRSLRQQLRPVFRDDAARRRIVFQFKENEIEKLLMCLEPQSFRRAENVVEIIKTCVESTKIKKALSNSFYNSFMQSFALNVELKQESQFEEFFKDIVSETFSTCSETTREKALTQMLNHFKPGKGLNISDKEIAVLQKASVGAALELTAPGAKLIKLIGSIPAGSDQVLRDLVLQFTELKGVGDENISEDAVNVDSAKKATDTDSAEKGDNIDPDKKSRRDDIVEASKDKDASKTPKERGSKKESAQSEINNESEPGGSIADSQKQDSKKASKEGVVKKDIDGRDSEWKAAKEGASKKSDDIVSLFASRPSNDAEPILIGNAGLVIFHPFLKFFFEGLDLLDDDANFISIDEAFKAIHLLQFIATGQESPPEHELALNKILCGLDLSEPVPRDYQLSENDKEECNHLMQTVLERWAALRTTNTEAFRSTYLLREGLLKQSGPGWNLTIERNSFDVMLEKLPWGISIIKFPWSAQMLYVEW